MKKNFVAWFGLFCLVLGTAKFSWARRLTAEDNGFVAEKYHQKTRVYADGHRQTRLAISYRVISEKGVQALSLYQIIFDVNRELIHDLVVRVSTNGTEYQVDPKDIEEKSMFSGFAGYDETKTKVVPLPNIAVGTRIHIEYTHDILKAEYPGLIMGRFLLSYPADTEDFYFELVLPKLLKHDIQDPGGALREAITVSEQGEERKIVVIKRPLPGIQSTLERNAFLPKKKLAWVEFTNATDFLAAGQKAREGYVKSLVEGPPDKVTELFGAGQQGQYLTDEDAAKRLAEAFKIIVKNFRYFADWRSVNGGFVPRALSEIARTGYGDCKDFAVLTVRVAEYLGLKADVALVFRSEDNYQTLGLPNLIVFNHAIVRVKKPKSEGHWWIDTTNITPHVGLVPPDIAGRKALVLAQKPELVDVPLDAAVTSQQKVSLVLDPTASPQLQLTAELTMSGHLGWGVQNDLHGESPQSVKEYLINFLGLSNFSVTDFRLEQFSKMQTQPFEISLKAAVADAAGIGRSGALQIIPVWTFGTGHHRIMDVVPKDRMADLNLGFLKEVDVKQFLKRDSYQKILGVPESCRLTSPWLDYTREVLQAQDFVIHDRYVVKKNRVAVEDVLSEDFINLQKDLKKCLEGNFVVVQ